MDSIAGDTCFQSRLSACVGERCSSAHVRRYHNLDILLCAQSQQSLSHGEIDLIGRSVDCFDPTAAQLLRLNLKTRPEQE
jgi:hypothetical protein